MSLRTPATPWHVCCGITPSAHAPHRGPRACVRAVRLQQRLAGQLVQRSAGGPDQPCACGRVAWREGGGSPAGSGAAGGVLDVAAPPAAPSAPPL